MHIQDAPVAWYLVQSRSMELEGKVGHRENYVKIKSEKNLGRITDNSPETFWMDIQHSTKMRSAILIEIMFSVSHPYPCPAGLVQNYRKDRQTFGSRKTFLRRKIFELSVWLMQSVIEGRKHPCFQGQVHLWEKDKNKLN